MKKVWFSFLFLVYIITGSIILFLAKYYDSKTLINWFSLRIQLILRHNFKLKTHN
jgi:nitrogen fixation/metabolism regulation signal transduction histidine kinase